MAKADHLMVSERCGLVRAFHEWIMMQPGSRPEDSPFNLVTFLVDKDLIDTKKAREFIVDNAIGDLKRTGDVVRSMSDREKSLVGMACPVKLVGEPSARAGHASSYPTDKEIEEENRILYGPGAQQPAGVLQAPKTPARVMEPSVDKRRKFPPVLSTVETLLRDGEVYLQFKNSLWPRTIEKAWIEAVHLPDKLFAFWKIRMPGSMGPEDVPANKILAVWQGNWERYACKPFIHQMDRAVGYCRCGAIHIIDGRLVIQDKLMAALLDNTDPPPPFVQMEANEETKAEIETAIQQLDDVPKQLSKAIVDDVDRRLLNDALPRELSFVGTPSKPPEVEKAAGVNQGPGAQQPAGVLRREAAAIARVAVLFDPKCGDGDHVMKPGDSGECYCGEVKKVDFRKYL